MLMKLDELVVEKLHWKRYAHCNWINSNIPKFCPLMSWMFFGPSIVFTLELSNTVICAVKWIVYSPEVCWNSTLPACCNRVFVGWCLLIIVKGKLISLVFYYWLNGHEANDAVSWFDKLLYWWRLCCWRPRVLEHVRYCWANRASCLFFVRFDEYDSQLMRRRTFVRMLRPGVS